MRETVLDELAGLLVGARRVAIDGPDAAGKTTLADELASRIDGRVVTRGTIDDFLWPAADRYRRGDESPEGYYFDAFDHDAVRTFAASAMGVLLFDGVFLFRPELDDLWDFRIFVDVDDEESLRRALERDVERFGSADAVRHRYGVRYQPAQRSYRERVRPESRADVVVDNTDVRNPRLARTPSHFRSRV